MTNYTGSGGIERLLGEVEQTIATLRGEADELRERHCDSVDVAEQLEHRADQLEETVPVGGVEHSEHGRLTMPKSNGSFGEDEAPDEQECAEKKWHTHRQKVLEKYGLGEED